MKVLLIDFYDSFTYNIYHYLRNLEVDVTVCEDKEIILDELESYECIIFSPGPGLPKETYSMFSVLKRYSNSKKILGICLGMQGVAEFYGAKLYNQESVRHGVAEKMLINKETRLFNGFPKNIDVGLYHSWAVELNESSQLISTGHLENGIVMAIEHFELPVFGVQFHPESILTSQGRELFTNFLFKC